MAVNKLITLELMTQYNTGIVATIDSKIATAISGLGDVFNIKGRKDTVSALSSITDAKNGDVWLVGAEGAAEFEEYYHIDGKWEYMGTTAPSLEGYVTETALYKGAAGTGTATAPAEGTILAAFKTLIDANTTAIEAINNPETGAVATATANAKSYTDTQVGAVDAKVTTNTSDIATLD